MRSLLVALGLSLLSATAHAQAAAAPAIPPELQARWDKAKLGADYTMDATINPWYLRGDFDGDGKGDYAVGVITLEPAPDTDPFRVVVLFAGKRGAKFFPDADMPARDGWYVLPKKSKLTGGLKLKFDAVEMWKAESSSAAIYWNAKKEKFVTYWTGD